MYNDKGFYFATNKANKHITIAQYDKLADEWAVIGFEDPFYNEGSKGADKEAERYGRVLIIGKEIKQPLHF